MYPTEYQYILLFGDQTVEAYPAVLKVVSESKKSPLLRTFLRNVTDTVQIEVASIDPVERASFREFNSVLDLAEHYRDEDDTLGIAHCVLICIARIGELILYGFPFLLAPKIGFIAIIFSITKIMHRCNC